MAGRLVNAVSEWTLGKRPPPESALRRLAAAAKLPISVFEEGGPMPSELLRRPGGLRSASPEASPSAGQGGPADGGMTAKSHLRDRMPPPIADNYDSLSSAKLWDMLCGAIKAEGRPELTRRLFEAWEVAMERERKR